MRRSTLPRQDFDHGTYCQILYTVAVAVGAGPHRDVVVHEVPLDVIAAPPQAIQPLQKVEEIKVTRCCCIPAGARVGIPF